MKSTVLLLPFIVLVSLSSAAPLFNETFDRQPDPTIWKTRNTSVEGGALVLKAAGPEEKFVGTGIETLDITEGLNIARKTVKIAIADIKLAGDAAPDRQAFVLFLGSDSTTEADATSYIRLVINGDGAVTLGVPKTDAEGKRYDDVILRRSIKLPLSKLVLTLDRTGYTLELPGGAKPEVVTGKWSVNLDLLAWEKAAPLFVVKCVRRPAIGSIQGTLGSLLIESR